MGAQTNGKALSRRSFLGAAAAAAAALSVGAECQLAACEPAQAAQLSDEERGEWRFGGCYYNCGAVNSRASFCRIATSFPLPFSPEL